MIRRPGGWNERLARLLLRLLPRELRAEYGAEVAEVLREGGRDAAGRGPLVGLRYWFSCTLDLLATGVRERTGTVRYRPRRRDRERAGRGGAERPPYGRAALAALAVWCLYVLTLAPTTTFWDASEYIAAGHVLGIPHPPGNPLFVLLARSWSILLAPLGLDVAVRINLLSAASSAAAHGFWFLVADRALRSVLPDPGRRHVGAFVAVLVSATAFTVWSQSNTNEKVYSVSLLTVAAVTWLALRWRDSRPSSRHLLLAGYLLALSAGNHLMGLLAVPALALFALRVDARAVLRRRFLAGVTALSALALSVHLFLPLRAELRPVISEGAPTCESLASALTGIYTWGRSGCPALGATLTREQYAKPPLTEDPTEPGTPRGPGLLASQLVNYLQYFDWQWARAVAGTDPLFGGVRPLFALLFLAAGIFGARLHWRSDPAGAAYLALLFATLSVGLVVYLNFRHGFSIGPDRLAGRELHEVRERDYFFLVGFSVWGVWAGAGLAGAWAAATRRLRGRVRRPGLAAAPVLGLALIPMALNWGYASRAGDYTARDWAYNLLMSVEPYGVLFTNGDNDTFPLWYLQEVEGRRPDVTVVVTSYLSAAWYARQIRDRSLPCTDATPRPAGHGTVSCQPPFRPLDLPPPLRSDRGAPATPEDSVLPLTDSQIDAIAAGAFVAREPLRFRAGERMAEIPAGTFMLPSDTFVTAIVSATLGKRPVYFVGASPVAVKLGLAEATVREGVALHLYGHDPAGTPGVEPLPADAFSPGLGRWVDVPRSDLLLEEVYLHRSGPPAALRPWPDPPSLSIPAQYLQAHLGASAGFTALGDPRRARRHAARAQEWADLIRGS